MRKISLYFRFLMLFIIDIIEHSSHKVEFADNEDFPDFNGAGIANSYGMNKKSGGGQNNNNNSGSDNNNSSGANNNAGGTDGSGGTGGNAGTGGAAGTGGGAAQDLSIDDARALLANPTDYITKLKDDAVVKWDGQKLTKAQIAEKFKVNLGTGAAGTAADNKVKIGGKEYTLQELEAEGVKYYKEKVGVDVDLSKLNEEQKNEFVLAFTKMAHVDAWKQSMGGRENEIGNERRNVESERAKFMTFKAEEESKLNERKVELSRKEYELKMLLGQDENAQNLTDEQRDKLIADKALAKSQIQNIQDENMAIDGQRVAIQLDRNIRALQLEFSELRTSVDIDEVTRRFLMKDPTVNPEDVSKMLAITEIVQTSRLFKQSPGDYYRLKRNYVKPEALPGANNNNNGTGGSTGGGLNNNNQGGNNNSSLSLEEQIKALRKKQIENPNLGGGQAPGAANLSGGNQTILSSNQTREEKLRALGY